MSGEESRTATTGELVNAGTIQGSALAEEARTRLQAAGINPTLEADPESTQGVGMGMLGDIKVMVPPQSVEQARTILEQVSQERGLPLDEQGGDRD